MSNGNVGKLQPGYTLGPPGIREQKCEIVRAVFMNLAQIWPLYKA